jgi:hypothetical protein
MKAGLAFIATEPLKDYEERRSVANAAKKDDKQTAGGSAAGGKPLALDRDKDDRGGKPDGSEGMMAGVVPDAARPGDRQKLLPVTPWGRYVKILLSSSEFIFVN